MGRFTNGKIKEVIYKYGSFIGLQFAVLLTCSFLTLYTFYTVKTAIENKTIASFKNITDHNLDALHERLHMYNQSLGGGVGFLTSSEHVKAEAWRVYVETLNIEDELQGVLGIGFIEAIQSNEIDQFLENARTDGVQGLRIHPETLLNESFIIKYIEPIENNKAALGLDIAFEDNRREAAERARRTGLSTLTRRIELAQDNDKLPGFLLLRPYYKKEVKIETKEQREIALIGWVYAVFLGGHLLNDLTTDQNENFYLTMHDGHIDEEKNIIYDGQKNMNSVHASKYTRTVKIVHFGKTWTAIWKSTSSFEESYESNSPYLVLVIGILLTFLIWLLIKRQSNREQIIQGIMEKRALELVATEDHNLSIINNAMIAILLLDEEMRIISVNQAVEDMFEYSKDELVGSSFYSIFPPKLVADPNTNEPVSTQNKSGNKLLIDIETNEWVNDKNEQRYSVLIRDVTQSYQNKVILKQAEERWSTALRSADIGVFDVNLITKVSVVSDTWKRLMNIPVNDRSIDVQKEFWKKVHPEDKALIKKTDQACIEGKTDRSLLEYRVQTEPGRWRRMRSEAAVVDWTEKGKALRLIGSLTDITSLYEAREALRVSREQFKALFAHAPVGMATIDEQASFTTVNKALCDFLGYSESDFIAKKYWDFMISSESRKIADIIGTLKTGERKNYQSEHQFVGRDKKIKWGLANVTLDKDPHTGRDLYIAQIQDIRKIKEIERIKSEFVATVSHELRTPLTSVTGALGLLKGTIGDDLPETSSRLLNIANVNCNKLTLLVNDILDMEKISSGKIKITYAKESIKNILKNSIEHMMPYADNQNVRIKFDTSTKDVNVWADALRVEQVLSNLLSNAAKFSCPNGEIHVKFKACADSVRVSVRDFGAGISEEFKTKIFEPFSQEDSSVTRKNEGTGLGLYITKQIVHEMGGEIGYESITDKHTTFWFTLQINKNQKTTNKRKLSEEKV